MTTVLPEPLDVSGLDLPKRCQTRPTGEPCRRVAVIAVGSECKECGSRRTYEVCEPCYGWLVGIMGGIWKDTAEDGCDKLVRIRWSEPVRL